MKPKILHNTSLGRKPPGRFEFEGFKLLISGVVCDASGCTSNSQMGSVERAPYTARFTFYTNTILPGCHVLPPFRPSLAP